MEKTGGVCWGHTWDHGVCQGDARGQGNVFSVTHKAGGMQERTEGSVSVEHVVSGYRGWKESREGKQEPVNFLLPLVL